MTEQYIRYAAMFIIIMMAVIDDYRRFKVSNRIIIAGMVIGVVINMGSLMYGGDVRGNSVIVLCEMRKKQELLMIRKRKGLSVCANTSQLTSF